MGGSRDESGLYATTRSLVTASSGPELRGPCLTIAHHADLSRIGETAVLKNLLIGREVGLSRLEPQFGRPELVGSEENDRTRPLADPYCSRRAITLRLAEDGAIVVDGSEAGTRLEIDGRPEYGRHRIARERLGPGRGVFIGLANRIVLHLGTVRLPFRPGSDDYGLIGRSESLTAAREDVARVAGLPVPVLILGESGTGKELIARAIGKVGNRRDKPFVALNMAALQPTTAASELFGHQRGAFTDAIAERSGALVDADSGTLFLDEIGLTPFEVQVMLLRAIETGEIRPLGARRPRRIDVRFIAATDSVLGAAVSEGKFSEALLNRLSGFVIRLPPLRERREDIGPLVAHFLRREMAAIGEEERLASFASNDGPYLTAPVMTRLLLAPWRGNVRRVQNVVRQMVIGSFGESRLRLDESLLDADESTAPISAAAEMDAVPIDAAAADPTLSSEEAEERAMIMRALQARAGNQSSAARDCNMSRNTFLHRLKKYGIRRPRMVVRS
jgi:two-component system nitrogen regulation response regulator GlnG